MHKVLVQNGGIRKPQIVGHDQWPPLWAKIAKVPGELSKTHSISEWTCFTCWDVWPSFGICGSLWHAGSINPANGPPKFIASSHVKERAIPMRRSYHPPPVFASEVIDLPNGPLSFTKTWWLPTSWTHPYLAAVSCFFELVETINCNSPPSKFHESLTSQHDQGLVNIPASCHGPIFVP